MFSLKIQLPIYDCHLQTKTLDLYLYACTREYLSFLQLNTHNEYHCDPMDGMMVSPVVDQKVFLEGWDYIKMLKRF